MAAWTDSGGGRRIISHTAGVVLPQATLGGTVRYCDPIGYNGANPNLLVQSDADSAAAYHPEFFAMAPGDAGDNIPVCTECDMRFDISSSTTVPPIGTKLYSSGTAGIYTTTMVDSGTGDVQTVVGIVTEIDSASTPLWFRAHMKSTPGKQGSTLNA